MNPRRTFRWGLLALVGVISSLLTALVMWSVRTPSKTEPEPEPVAPPACAPRLRAAGSDRYPIPHEPQTPARYMVDNIRFAAALVGVVVLAGLAGWFGSNRETAHQAKTLAISLTGGSPDKGEAAIATYGCASCHTIPGIRGANALVGPPLTQLGSRSYIGGVITNTPDHLMRWIQNPPGINPQTAMPNVGVTDPDARDIAAYLYTLQ